MSCHLSLVLHKNSQPKLKHIVVLFFLPLFCTRAYTQTDSTKSVQQTILRAQQKTANFDFATAEELLQKALKIEPESIDVRLALGKLAIKKYDWRAANNHFEKVLERDAENLEAHYYRAICYREIGKFRPEFLRKMPLIGGLLEFKKSEQHFNWLLERDSLYRDVLSQIATLRRYQEKYDDALQLAHRQIVLKPSQANAQVGIFNLYRHFILRKSENKAVARLLQTNSPYARFFIGEKLRREKRYARADSIFAGLLGEKPKMPLQPVYLALAKSKSSQKEDHEAEQFFWKAVDSISSQADADLVFEEIKYVINQREYQEYLSLSTPDEKAGFFRAFWARRNPMPAAEDNARLAEHLRRLNYCEQNYEFIGFRSWGNSPDKLQYLRFPPAYHLNEFFNDKGLVYLRHGEPHDRIVTVGGGVNSQSPAPSNESWKYWPTDASPEMTFHFMYDQYASGNLWRLTPILSHPALLEDRFQWSPRYYRMQNAYSAGERYMLEQEMAQESIASVDTGFVSDRHSWSEKVKELPMPYSTATFRGKNGKTVLEVYWGVPLKPIANALSDDIGNIRLENGAALHFNDWREAWKQLKTSDIVFDRNKLSDDHLFTESYSTEISPGTYFLALHARPEQTVLIGGHANIDLVVHDYSGSSLRMSDIEFASQIEPAEQRGKWIKNGLKVIPNPARQYEQKRPVHIYFEIYNLSRDSDGKTRFAIEYIVEKKGGKKKFLGLFGGGKSSISVKADRQGNASFSAEFLAIDVGKVDKGEARLTIRVTDKISGAIFERTNTFEIY